MSGQDSNRETFATSGWVLHPEYNPDTLSHDIGLIELRLEITFTSDYAFLCKICFKKIF